MTSDRLTLRPAPFGHPDSQALVAEVQTEYVSLYGSPDESPLEADGFDPPRGAFFVGYADSVPVTMGGWRMRDDVHPWGRSPTAEIKRMYVVPAARRRGHAWTVLAHLERSAALAGATAVVLETGTAQPAAIALYAAAGYQPIVGYGHYRCSPLSRCFGKPL